MHSLTHSLTHSPLFLSFVSFLELKLGRVLGRGGFCVVQEIINIKLAAEKEDNKDYRKLPLDASEHTFYNIVQDRGFMQVNCLRGKGKDCRYALKILQPASYKDTVSLCDRRFQVTMTAIRQRVRNHFSPFHPPTTIDSSPFQRRPPLSTGWLIWLWKRGF
jgi:hypothetical protein